jgi:hypothetical protein
MQQIEDVNKHPAYTQAHKNDWEKRPPEFEPIENALTA